MELAWSPAAVGDFEATVGYIESELASPMAARPRRSKGASGGTPESRAAGAFSTPSFNRHCDRQSDRHLTDKTGLKGETKENGAGCRRREKTRIRSSAWCLQKPQTSQNFEKPQVKPLITERSLARQP